ncbi:MAG TPA: T9SS type A sorting domain-containing protein, partial [Bacteroidia bacterium]|nr:T9SS type A sorting domain-containing protein [Bacteroidia bacterium]
TSLPAGTTTLTVTDAHGCSAVATVNVINPPLLTDSLSVTNNCYNGDSAIALINVNGGTGPFTYSWNTGATTEQIGGLAPGTYTGTVIDHNGCTANNSVIIANPTKLTSAISSINVACHGGNTGSAWEVASGGTAPYSYTWKPGPNVDTIPNISAGTYALKLTDAQGCVTRDTVKISQPTAITAVTSYTTATCLSSNGSASVSVSGGTPGYKYSWSPSGNTNVTATGLSAGSYTCTITDANSCTAIANVTVPTVIETVNITSSTNDLCNGGKTGSITAGVTGGATPYTYAWTPTGGAAATASLLSAGTYTVTVKDHNGCAVTASTTITQPSKIRDSIATGSQVNVSCNGSSNGSVTIGVKNGTPGYNFVWTPNVSSAASATGLSAGKYTVAITDANGCAGTTLTVTITQPAILRDSAVATLLKNVTCYGGTNGYALIGTKGGTAPYTYKWSTGSTSNPNSTLSAGSYSVTVTDKNGCTAIASVTIAQPSAIRDSITSVLTPLCNGANTGQAAVGVTGGTPGYTYMWSPAGGTAAVAFYMTAGSYTVTVKDKNLCSATAKVTITQPSKIRDSIITASQVNVLCNGGSTGSVTIGVKNGTPGYNFVWTPNVSSNATATGLSAGKYTVAVTDANGCTGTALTVTITQATAIRDSIVATTLKNATCNGGTNGSATVGLKGGTAPYTYLWSTGSTSNPDATLSAGSYSVTITDKNGCTAVATATIGQPSAIRDSITASLNAACYAGKTGSATVGVTGGTPGYTYTWSPSGGTAATGINMGAGSYTVTIKDKNLCLSTSKVTLTQPSKIRDSVITASLVEVSCNGGSNGAVTVGVKDGTPGYIYSWSPSISTGSSATGLSAGIYTVAINDANGCPGTAEIITITQPAILRDSITHIACSSLSKGSATVGVKGGTAPYSYAWAPSGGSAATASVFANTYTVTVTDKKGCTVQAVAIVPTCSLGETDPSSDINTVPNDAERKVTLYPDPNNGQFTINGLEEGSTVEIYNAMGALVRTVQVKDVTSQFNISELPNGIYLLRVISQDGTIMAQPKMIKSW